MYKHYFSKIFFQPTKSYWKFCQLFSQPTAGILLVELSCRAKSVAVYRLWCMSEISVNQALLLRSTNCHIQIVTLCLVVFFVILLPFFLAKRTSLFFKGRSKMINLSNMSINLSNCPFRVLPLIFETATYFTFFTTTIPLHCHQETNYQYRVKVIILAMTQIAIIK